MIGRIMLHEWRLLTRERLLYIAVPLYALLLAYGVHTGTQWRGFLEGNIAAAAGQADKKLSGLLAKVERIEAGEAVAASEDPRFPAKVARFQGYEIATKPPLGAAAVAIGQSDIQPSYVKVQWAPMFSQANTDEIQNPTNLAVGLIDLGFVIIYLYPLLIIALSYNMLSSERENGTQALLLSQPVLVTSFVAGKVLLRGLLVIGLALLLPLVGLILGNNGVLDAQELWRLALLAGVIAIYGAFWFGVAAFVNGFSSKSSTNALVLMSIWLGLVLILPASLSLLAKSMYPLPSRIEMTQALRRGDALVKKEAGFQRPFNRELLERGADVALNATIGEFYQTLLPLEARAEAAAAPIFERFEAQRRSQQLLAERLKYLSPAVLTQFSLQQIAAQSAADFAHFMAQVGAFHRRWREYFLPLVMSERLMTRKDVAEIPRFEYQPRPRQAVLLESVRDLLALIGFAVCAIAAGFWRLRRYEPATR